jgi:hypothetical protein
MAQGEFRTLAAGVQDSAGAASSAEAEPTAPSAEVAPDTGAQDPVDDPIRASGVRNSAEEDASRENAKRLAKLTAAATVKDADIVAEKMFEQQRRAGK